MSWTRQHKDAIATTIAKGVSKTVRNEVFYELAGQSHEFVYPPRAEWNDYLPNRPGSDHRISIIEGLQLIAGRSYPELLSRYGNLRKYRDGQIFEGAYGTRAAKSLAHCAVHLGVGDMMNLDSRQAVAMVYRPDDTDHIHSTKDIPCTISFQFLSGGGDILHMIANMRSSDLYWGWTYDLTQFAMLHATFAHTLKFMNPGSLFLQLGSQHLYQRNRDGAMKYLNQSGADARFPSRVVKDDYMFAPNITPLMDWTYKRQVAHDILKLLTNVPKDIVRVAEEFNLSPFLSSALRELAPWKSD